MAAVVMRPTKAEQFDFLQLRHQLKDRIRMKKSRGSDAAHGCSVSSTTDDNKKKLPFDNFGFFFGLSEHVMAKKVSEEMKDFVPELKKLASRVLKIPKPSKGEHEEVGKSKSSSAKSESSSTKQCSMKPMPKQNKPVLKHSIKYRLKEERPEVKDRVTEEQSVDVSSVIQKIFGCNRKRPRDDDDGDDRAMVPTIDDILNEERKSAKIAKEEDERERLLLEKEEKQEERLRATKKLKLKIKIKVSKN
ncbi:hypothetical protein TB1_003674 [Malus domestica]